MGADSHPSFHVTIFYLDKIPNALYQREREREREREKKREPWGLGGLYAPSKEKRLMWGCE